MKRKVYITKYFFKKGIIELEAIVTEVKGLKYHIEVPNESKDKEPRYTGYYTIHDLHLYKEDAIANANDRIHTKIQYYRNKIKKLPQYIGSEL